MPVAIDVNSTQIWPTLAEVLAEQSRDKIITRETMGADVLPRTLDRMNGMERTGAPDEVQRLFGGIVASDNMDWVIAGNTVARDAITPADDLHRGMQTLHLGTGHILNTSI